MVNPCRRFVRGVLRVPSRIHFCARDLHLCCRPNWRLPVRPFVSGWPCNAPILEKLQETSASIRGRVRTPKRQQKDGRWDCQKARGPVDQRNICQPKVRQPWEELKAKALQQWRRKWGRGGTNAKGVTTSCSHPAAGGNQAEEKQYRPDGVDQAISG